MFIYIIFMDSLEDIWSIADEGFKRKELVNKVISECTHSVTQLDTQTADLVCQNCGVIICNKLHNGAEWNNYKDESGNYSKNSQRGDLYIDDNPYSVGGTVCGLFSNNKTFAAKIHLSSCFSHKQRTYWKTSQIYENICSKYCLTKSVLETAKRLWHICMESGKLTRASVREGLIASCLYYSCIYNKTPISRDDILIYFECDNKTLTKGEKVFYEIIEQSDDFKHLTKQSINVEQNNSFIRYCNILNLPWKVAMECNKVFNENKNNLEFVTPKSAVCGVMVYVIKKKLELKIPTKTEISKLINVCTPTINKVVDILIKNNN